MDIYERLAEYLDRLPSGFPRTESGVELRILRRLFSPEDAALALHLTLLPEEARVIALRAGLPVQETAARLEDMECRGLLNGSHSPGQPARYQASHYVVGIYEYQVNRMDETLARDFAEYMDYFAQQPALYQAPQLRTIPVGESIPHEMEVLPYEQAEALVRSQRYFAVSDCICRKEKRILGEGCGRSLETCLMLGGAAHQTVHTGRGREISMQEALAILHRAELEGLVLQPANTRDSVFICACCGCCCGVLTHTKHYPEPAGRYSSAFRVHLEPEACDGCATCQERCQMEAIVFDERLGQAVLDDERCIGCGLCVTSCPCEALTLERKPAREQPDVPRSLVQTMVRLANKRGHLGVGEMASLVVRSGVDRLRAPRA